MTDWLFRDDNYIPPKDKDSFIDKSILSFLSVLSLTTNWGGKKIVAVNIDERIKVVFTIILVLLVSLSRNISFIILADVYLLLYMSLLDIKEIVKILRLGLVVTIFTFAILLPSLYMGNVSNTVMMTLKVFTSVITVSIFSYTTELSLIVASLKVIFIPDIFIFVLDTAVKFIIVLGELSLNMLYALKLRSIGKNNDKYNSLSGIAGTLFIRSKEMSEEMHQAMECRGFTGQYTFEKKFKITLLDSIYIIINLAILISFVYLRGYSL